MQSFNSNWGSDLDLNDVQFWVSVQKVSHILVCLSSTYYVYEGFIQKVGVQSSSSSKVYLKNLKRLKMTLYLSENREIPCLLCCVAFANLKHYDHLRVHCQNLNFHTQNLFSRCDHDCYWVQVISDSKCSILTCPSV